MNLRRNILLMPVVVMLISVLPAGCSYQNTGGRTHKFLPVEFGIFAKAAVASGEEEQKIGVGKNAVADVTKTETGFNEARVGIAQAESKVESETTITKSRRPARDLK